MPRRKLRLARARAEVGEMSRRKDIAAEQPLTEWRKDLEHDALREESAIGAAMNPPGHTPGSRAEPATEMGTTQSAIARPKGGKSKASTTAVEKIARGHRTLLTWTYR